jgi:hypothetical protein
MKKNQKIFLLWLLMVIIWNYGFPKARPIYDVLIAVILSHLSILLNKKL